MADLTVRGAGVFGLTIAWVALTRGAKVCVVDPIGPGGGASGGIVGALQPHTPDIWNEKKQFQLESLLMSKLFWQEIEATSGIPTGYTRSERLQPLPGEREVVLARARATAATENWGDNASWQVIDSDTAGGWRPPSPTGLYVHDTLSALIHPRLACESLAAAIRAHGGEIVDEAPDKGAVIWATGWQGLRDLSREFGRAVGSGVKGQAALLRHDAAGRAQIFAEALHIVPHLDGTIAIGSTSQRKFSDPQTTDSQVDDLIQRATEVMPVLKGARVIERWAGVRPRASTRAPLLGPWPNRPDHFVANGGFKIGFGVAPKVANAMCDLILDGKDDIPESFRLSAD
ncbi:MAG: NAD(P)/FAD-dependent oxidoreductase [Boseongicola sp.]